MYALGLSIRKQSVSIPPHSRSDPHFETFQDSAGREFAFGFPEGDQFLLRVCDLGTFLIQPGYSEATGFADAGVDPGSLRDMFFHAIAPWMLQRGPWECVHGSAVLAGGGVVAFSGMADRGKSTLARAWCDRGAYAYADDAVPFLVRDGVVMGACLPQRLRLRGPAAARFPKDSPAVGNGVAASEHAHDLEPTMRPLRSIYWVETMREPEDRPLVQIDRIPGAEAFHLLLPQGRYLSFRDPACNSKMVRNYLSLVRLTPVFRLSFAAGLDLLPAVLDRLEEHQQKIAVS